MMQWKITMLWYRHRRYIDSNGCFSEFLVMSLFERVYINTKKKHYFLGAKFDSTNYKSLPFSWDNKISGIHLPCLPKSSRFWSTDVPILAHIESQQHPTFWAVHRVWKPQICRISLNIWWSWGVHTLQKTSMSLPKECLKIFCNFPKMGYRSSLEGKLLPKVRIKIHDPWNRDGRFFDVPEIFKQAPAIEVLCRHFLWSNHDISGKPTEAWNISGIVTNISKKQLK